MRLLLRPRVALWLLLWSLWLLVWIFRLSVTLWLRIRLIVIWNWRCSSYVVICFFRFIIVKVLLIFDNWSCWFVHGVAHHWFELIRGISRSSLDFHWLAFVTVLIILIRLSIDEIHWLTFTLLWNLLSVLPIYIGVRAKLI